MRVCFHISLTSRRVVGAWWEPDEASEEDLHFAYDDQLCIEALQGIDTMHGKPPHMTWRRYWNILADRISPLDWWEVGEVDDGSSAYDLLYHLGSCNPRRAERRFKSIDPAAR